MTHWRAARGAALAAAGPGVAVRCEARGRIAAIRSTDRMVGAER